MIEEMKKPEEILSDEQLEDVIGGTFDNNWCTAVLTATVNLL